MLRFVYVYLVLMQLTPKRPEMLLCFLYLSLILAIKREDSQSAPGIPHPNSNVIGVNKPAGPLSEAYQSSNRFPGFPFEFPPIVPGSDKKYLIFPEDSAANFLASARRCGALGGRLVRLETAVEMEILACAVTRPVFIASWMGNDFGGPISGACPVLYPGGVVASIFSIHDR